MLHTITGKILKNSYFWLSPKTRVVTQMVDGGQGVSPRSPHRNEVWRMVLGAHPKLEALVRPLLELRFLLGYPYLAIGV